jgi:hypothetical protein
MAIALSPDTIFIGNVLEGDAKAAFVIRAKNQVGWLGYQPTRPSILAYLDGLRGMRRDFDNQTRNRGHD